MVEEIEGQGVLIVQFGVICLSSGKLSFLSISKPLICLCLDALLLTESKRVLIVLGQIVCVGLLQIKCVCGILHDLIPHLRVPITHVHHDHHSLIDMAVIANTSFLNEFKEPKVEEEGGVSLGEESWALIDPGLGRVKRVLNQEYWLSFWDDIWITLDSCEVEKS